MVAPPMAAPRQEHAALLPEDGRPEPPTAAGPSHRPRSGCPAWVHATRWTCNILCLAMVLLVASLFPRCKDGSEVFALILCLATTLLVPFFVYMVTSVELPGDEPAGHGGVKSIARAAPRYTRREEHVGRSMYLAVSLLGLYVIYIATMRANNGAALANKYLWTVFFGVMGTVSIIGHTTIWIRACYTRED